jgi:hypothetical protein
MRRENINANMVSRVRFQLLRHSVVRRRIGLKTKVQTAPAKLLIFVFIAKFVVSRLPWQWLVKMFKPRMYEAHPTNSK